MADRFHSEVHDRLQSCRTIKSAVGRGDSKTRLSYTVPVSCPLPSLALLTGPYGDVDRYDWSASLDGTTSLNDTMSGFFERSISIFR